APSSPALSKAFGKLVRGALARLLTKFRSRLFSRLSVKFEPATSSASSFTSSALITPRLRSYRSPKVSEHEDPLPIILTLHLSVRPALNLERLRTDFILGESPSRWRAP